MSRQKLVVIGNGMVGQRLLDRIVAEDSDFDITVLCEEPRAAYDRVQLTGFFSGKSAEDLSLVTPEFFDRHAINIHFSDKAIAIDRAAKTVTSSQGHTFEYDKLVLATGSYPFVPPLPGRDRPNCFVYRTIEDLEAIRAAAATAKIGVVIGGGLLGLEAAKALKDDPLAKELVVDFSRSSVKGPVTSRLFTGTVPGTPQTVSQQRAPLELKDGEPLRLDIFVDRSVIEVFANGIQCVTQVVYPELATSTGVKVFSGNETVSIRNIQSWSMAATNAY